MSNSNPDACAYCASSLDPYDPLVLYQDSGERALVGGFCNYACLTQYIHEEDLESGACCRLPRTDS